MMVMMMMKQRPVMNAINVYPDCRHISTTSFLAKGYFESTLDKKKQDFGTLRLYNKRHLPEHKKFLFAPFERPNDYNIRPHNYGCRGTGIRHATSWEHIPEKVPEIIVPDLTDCPFKPYVSYQTKDIYQEPLTARDLFNVTYGPKIYRDFLDGQLDDQGESLRPSSDELRTSEEAWMQARQTGSDIFLGGTPRPKIFELKFRSQLPTKKR